MTVYAFDFRDKPLEAVTGSDVADALATIWKVKPALAAKVRRLWERVFDHPAMANKAQAGWRNPARWSAELRAKVQPQPPGTGPASFYQDLPFFMDALRSGRGLGRMALELSVLTCLPPERVCTLSWSDLVDTGRGWMLAVEVQPPERAGGLGGERRAVPLTDGVAKWLQQLKPTAAADDFIFPSSDRTRPLSGGGARVIANRLFGTRAPRLDPDAVAGAFRAWARDRDLRRGGPSAGALLDATVEVALNPRHARAGAPTPAVLRPSTHVRALVLAWQAFLGRP